MSQKYTNFLRIRITDLEKETFQILAETANITISELIRRRIKNIPIIAKTDVTLLNELRRQGGLLKHCINEIRKSNLTQVAQDKSIIQLEETLIDLQALAEKIDIIFSK